MMARPWITVALALALVGVGIERTLVEAQTPEARAAARLEAVRGDPVKRIAFLRAMPKGADLHSHLSGAIYAESMIGWAAAKSLCVRRESLALATCATGDATLRPANDALADRQFFGQLVDAWSMRNFRGTVKERHDHFFATFSKYLPSTDDRFGEMLAETTSRAARGHVSYLELMVTPDGLMASGLGATVGWDGDAAGAKTKLEAAGISRAVDAVKESVRIAEARRKELLGCGTPAADAGCQVTVRYLYQVLRALPNGPVFAQCVLGFLLASDPSSSFVGLNMVQPEDSASALANYSAQMEMLAALRPLFPKVKLSLHAGELTPAIAQAEALTSHVRQAVGEAEADRIGHAVDILGENQAASLLAEMARRRTLVEICLTSNAMILGVTGRSHPLAALRRAGVPVALATDDEGVSRSEMTLEFDRAVVDQGLGYSELKSMARASLEHAFIDGASLWRDERTFTRAAACVGVPPSGPVQSPLCQGFLAASAKARLQWKLEQDFAAFERER